ncbi:MAG: tetratricopeptide repeat protein [Phycisphaerales bacterium]
MTGRDAERTVSPGSPGAESRVVSLPLLEGVGGASGGGGVGGRGGGGAGRKGVRGSRMSRWRAGVLIGVHVLIIAHVTQWLITGRTVSPVEPSESMETLEVGVVNAGFIFFGVAILSTLLFGRFMCGWACHVVALQDLCAWMMKKVGVRPKPFRSRLLVLIPVGLAIYMFVWPSFKRLAVFPALEALEGGSPVGGAASWALGVLRPPAAWPVDGAAMGLVVDDFWATFPGPMVAVVFLLICGFAAVYFLGAKGFCTYGCPYGGIFAPVDQLSPGRIVVDDSKCDGNAHCTAVCTSNVRVHEEIARYGMVVDPGCMKCMDCVSVCPSNALSFRFARPAILKGRGRDPGHANARRKGKGPLYDTTIGEDLGLLAVFVITFMSVRGVYDLVPMLMAMGVAGVVTFLAFKAWEVVRRDHARFRRWQFKRGGRVTGAGAAYLAMFGALALSIGHAGVLNFFAWRGDLVHDRLPFNPATLFTGAPPVVDEPLRERAASAAAAYERVRPIGAGGLGLVSNPSVDLRLATMRVLTGDRDGAIVALERVLEREDGSEAVYLRLGNLLIDEGRVDEAIGVYERALDRLPWASTAMQDLGGLLISEGRIEEAEERIAGALERIPDQRKHDDARSVALELLGHIAARRGDGDLALERYRAAVSASAGRAQAHESLAGGLLNVRGDAEGAIAALERSAELEPENPARWLRLMQLVGSVRGPGAGREVGDRAIAALERARDERPRRGERWMNLARMQATLGRVEEAVATVDAALRADLPRPIASAELAEFAARLGRTDVRERWGLE